MFSYILIALSELPFVMCQLHFTEYHFELAEAGQVDAAIDSF